MFFSFLFFFFFFFFNDTATTEIYTLSLHDALPILFDAILASAAHLLRGYSGMLTRIAGDHIELAALMSTEDRKSTRLNSSHVSISYAVFCLKKKKKKNKYIVTILGTLMSDYYICRH